jgi:hypothetical protein
MIIKSIKLYSKNKPNRQHLDFRCLRSTNNKNSAEQNQPQTKTMNLKSSTKDLISTNITINKLSFKTIVP